MAGPQLDASLRRATLLAEARGFVVPDTKPALDPTPQVIIEGDDEDIFLDFDDGLGYTTDKNAYKNYGHKFIWVHNGVVQDSASSQSVSDDLDAGPEGTVPVYNEDTGKYEPVPLVGAACVEIAAPEDRVYTLVPSLPFDIDVTDTFSDSDTGPFSVAFPSGTLSAGDPLEVTVSGTDSSTVFLRVQVSFTYRFV